MLPVAKVWIWASNTSLPATNSISPVVVPSGLPAVIVIFAYGVWPWNKVTRLAYCSSNFGVSASAVTVCDASNTRVWARLEPLTCMLPYALESVGVCSNPVSTTPLASARTIVMLALSAESVAVTPADAALIAVFNAVRSPAVTASEIANLMAGAALLAKSNATVPSDERPDRTIEGRSVAATVEISTKPRSRI